MGFAYATMESTDLVYWEYRNKIALIFFFSDEICFFFSGNLMRILL